MPPVISSKLTQQTSDTLCYYFNSTNKMQLIRLWDGKKYSLEKIIFPHQRFLFKANPEGILEVHTKHTGKQILESIFVCNSLKVKQSQAQLAIV